MNSSTGYGKEGDTNSNSPSGGSPEHATIHPSNSPKGSGSQTSVEPEGAAQLSASSARALVTETTLFSQGFRLTPRETEIVVVLAEGITRIKDIADRLKLSPNTVNNHVNSIFMKTKARSKSQLLAMLLGRISLELQSARIFRQQPRVALITSSERLRQPLYNALSESGFSVEVFTSQKAFLNSVATLHPHFVVADLAVGDLNSNALFDELCAHGAMSAVFVGQSETISTRCEAMELGAIDLFDASAEPQRLVNTLLGHYIENDADRARFLNCAQGKSGEIIEAKNAIHISQSTLGRGGIFLSASEVERGFARVLKVGDRLDLHLAVESVDRPFRAQGEVVWVRETGHPAVAGAGVRLLHLVDASETDRESWHNIVRRNPNRSYIPTGALNPA